ncbi:MAG: hypothetical protein ACOZQL_26535 [Myxococcota bacterium]
MTDLVPWPKALEAWQPELHRFARDLVGHLAPLSERVANLLGPLRRATEQRADEPNGYSALSRRGPYERLVASEWALQLEDPDEFIRRASSGEHLFVELERRSPATALEAWVLLDSGPDQLGAPRIAQLATLVAFARRAREAGVVLRWAPVRDWEKAPHEAIDAASVQAWLASRTPWVPTDGVLAQWPARWAERAEVIRDVWLVGSPETGRLGAARGWGTVVIDDRSGDGLTQLELRVTPPGSSRTRTLQLPLPASALQVRLLRDPFDWAQPKPPPPKKRKDGAAIPLEPATELAFSHDSHRLLARTLEGSVAALPLPNTGRATYGWPSVAVLPPRSQLIAASWASRRAKGTVVRTEKGALVAVEWDGRVGAPVSRELTGAPLAPSELRLAMWPVSRGWEGGEQFGRASERACASFVVAVREGPELDARFEAEQRWVSVRERPEAAWACWAPGGPVGVCLYADRVDVVLGQARPVQVRALPRPLFARDRIVGVGVEGAAVLLYALHQDQRTIRTLVATETAPQWREETRARAPIEFVTVAQRGDLVAWRDRAGELGVYSRTRAETVLRVHVRDAGVDLP